MTTNGLSPPDFVSPWTSITAYSNPEVTITHGFGEMPMKLDVFVRVTHPVHGTVTFPATGSGQTSDDPSKPFGGVIYLYNTNSVKIMAPGPSSCSSPCSGGVAYFGDSGFSGPSSTSGVIVSGEVMVRAWKTCTFVKPATISAAYPLSNAGNNYYQIPIGSAPDLVLVKAFFDDGWIMDAQGTVSLTEGSNVGGVQYVFDVFNAYVRTPKDGKMFNGINWGSAGDLEYINGSVRVYTWSFQGLEYDPNLLTSSYSGSTDPVTKTLTYDVHNSSIIMMVHASSRDPNHYGLTFPVSGTAMTDGGGVTGNYGSLFYAYDNNNQIFFWKPSSETGCHTMIGGAWSDHLLDGTTDCSNLPNIDILFLQATIDELPCEEKGCSGTPAGPFCDCAGTGMEGQYCSSRVACPPLIFGVDAIFATFIDMEYKFQDSVVFECMVGFEFSSGSDNRTCQADATWSGAPYTCTPVPCPDVDPPILGVINGTYNKWFGEEVTFECNPGHDVLSGDFNRTCQANQTWTGTRLECALSCGDPDPLPYNAHQTNFGNTYGVVATYACDQGHEYSSGDTAMLCQTTGQWNGTALNCSRVHCGWPANGTNTNMTITGTQYQDKVFYHCFPGYEYYNIYNTLYYETFPRHCLHTAVWQPPIDCQKKVCGDPGTPVRAALDHANSNVGNYEFMSIQRYNCYTGYEVISGSLQIECTEFGTWNDTVPTCDIRKCIHFGNVTNGFVYYQGLEYLNHAVTVCDPGYALSSGDAMRMCDANGYWTGNVPVCQEVRVIYFIDPFDLNYTLPSILELEELKNTVKIDPKNTSSYMRSLKSQNDPRPSAMAIGVSGLLIILGICAYICSLDLISHVRENGKVKVTQGMPKNNTNVVAENGSSDKFAKKGKKRNQGSAMSVEDTPHVYA